MTIRDLRAYKDQHDSIRKEFKKQAASWGKDEVSSHLQWVVNRLDLQPHDEVLDVAAGSGLLSRALSPHVKRVVAVDITPEMLAQGIKETDRQGITNVSFEQGAAENLDYPTASFDMVVTRFSMHHLKCPKVVIREMCRVCRSGGTLVVIDILSSEDEDLAARYNDVERLRDSSHAQALSATGLKTLVKKAGIRIIDYYSLEVENSLDEWLDFARAESGTRQQIHELMHRELQAGEKTGMRAFLDQGKLMFMHTWGIVVGKKS